MGFTLRKYQEEAIQRVIWAKGSNLEGNSVVVLPTGAGKSIVIAEIIHRLNEPVLILQPTREILQQNLEKLAQYVNRSEIGVYSAAMNEKTIRHYTFATIGSIYKKPEKFINFGLIIIDECHLVSPKNLNGMFMTFINKVNKLRENTVKPVKIVGFTATPYRLDTKYVPDEDSDWMRAVTITKLIMRMPGFFWQRVLYCVNIADLINSGYLCPLAYIDKAIVKHENLKLNKSRSDFDLPAYEEMISDKYNEIVETIEYGERTSKSVLVFCSSVQQAEELSKSIPGSAVVSAKTPKKERSEIIEKFKDGRLKIVMNVSVLTIGFDHPSLDCIILIRPTKSICLLMQMIGRGVRIASGKTSCKVIDLTSTIENVGRIETIKVIKKNNWELESEIRSWHNEEIYSYKFKR